MMGLARETASSLSGVKRAVVAAAMALVVCAAPAAAQDADTLMRVADEMAAKGLPSAPLANKIREGLAKGVDPKRIEQVIRQMAAHLETADRLIREIDPAAAGREAPVTLMAESLGSGVTLDQVRELRRQAQPSAAGRPVTAESMASAAKGLSLIEEVRLPVADGTAVMAETVRQGYRPAEMVWATNANGSHS